MCSRNLVVPEFVRGFPGVHYHVLSESRCKKGRHTIPSGIVCLHAHTCDILLQPGFSIRFPFTALLFVILSVSIMFSGLQPAASASCCAVSTAIIPQPAFCTQAFSARAARFRPLPSRSVVSVSCRDSNWLRFVYCPAHASILSRTSRTTASIS